MICDIILTRQKNKYLAKLKNWPDIMVMENTRDKAIKQIKKQLTEYLTEEAEIIQIEIPVPLSAHKANPWLNNSGRFKDDPTFDDLLAEIAEQRLKSNQTQEQYGQ